MNQKLKKLTTQLVALSECADTPQILYEEIQVIQDKAFKAQDEIMELLEQMENDTKDISTLQNIFQIRENVWDIMSKLAAREQQIKKTKNKKAAGSNKQKCHCGCHHEHDTCCCQHKDEPCQKKGKSCKKK